jgi:hypothetical protein
MAVWFHVLGQDMMAAGICDGGNSSPYVDQEAEMDKGEMGKGKGQRQISLRTCPQ